MHLKGTEEKRLKLTLWDKLNMCYILLVKMEFKQFSYGSQEHISQVVNALLLTILNNNNDCLFQLIFQQ